MICVQPIAHARRKFAHQGQHRYTYRINANKRACVYILYVATVNCPLHILGTQRVEFQQVQNGTRAACIMHQWGNPRFHLTPAAFAFAINHAANYSVNILTHPTASLCVPTDAVPEVGKDTSTTVQVLCVEHRNLRDVLLLRPADRHISCNSRTSCTLVRGTQ